ncbi:phenylalanine--tRNA ligase subunit alpha [Candidatus Kuenenbacteria bacterium HGW-Kuenenbacteria-1]|uniref:Phenylalanine--tRNA ligase alpha subunit n=1 Tax=Candidatus Kuenenbacteria bacterium HGW-Kuenenbacteria-1 TaxID=2013812 RepID=A0A2N1UNK8_9BACT|nr:MAG: phenylalanine--tRNA ligase subunit alpha [Candidatus Kuenenbacteria bacterium HGW-Kuenenbacteria-1]
MQNKLQNLKNQILDQLKIVKTSQVLRDLEIKYLGRKGELTEILHCLKDLTVQEKKEIGKLANEIKKDLFEKFKEVKNIIAKNAVKSENIDVTLPGEKIQAGHLHPITLIQNELEDLFVFMGFMVLDGPELESDYYNFEAMNIPKHHPARDMQDTFYIDQKNKNNEYDLVMRTHTSNVQVRAMQKYGTPLKCVAPGRVFRCEATDVRHEHTFYQFEGFMVDKKINLSHLKAVLEITIKHLYGQKTKMRLRPKFYPFVEPGVNGEVSCFSCNGKGCRLCKNSGWLEIFGAGMVHPNVLKAGNIDPKKYSGFAFGFGLTRLAMLKYGINDVRLFNSGDLRFLEQF